MKMRKRNMEEMRSVKTSIECDVKENINREVAEAVSKVVDECSKKYYRNLKVDFIVEMD